MAGEGQKASWGMGTRSFKKLIFSGVRLAMTPEPSTFQGPGSVERL
jgi:hypothetical protein